MDTLLPDGSNRWSNLLARAQSAGLQTNLELVSLQADRLREVAGTCLPYLDSIVINEVEAAALTGIETSLVRRSTGRRWRPWPAAC